jgi:hypothetical protein
MQLSPDLKPNLLPLAFFKAVLSQGDLMYIFLIAQSVAQPIFCRNDCIILTVGKSSPKMRARLVIFQTVPNVNNRSVCKNSPNLVTLLSALTKPNVNQSRLNACEQRRNYFGFKL